MLKLNEAATKRFSQGRVAIVHDFLVVYGGAERVLRELIALVPDCDLFSVVDFLSESQRANLFGKHAKTTFIQRLPLPRENTVPIFRLCLLRSSNWICLVMIS